MRLRIYIYLFVHQLRNKLNKYTGQHLCTGRGRSETTTKKFLPRFQIEEGKL
jgi:hypothetical protein